MAMPMRVAQRGSRPVADAFDLNCFNPGICSPSIQFAKGVYVYQSYHWLYLLTSTASFLGLVVICVFGFIWAVVARNKRHTASNRVMAGLALILFSVIIATTSSFFIARFFPAQDVLFWMAISQLISIPTHLLGLFCLVHAALGPKDRDAHQVSDFTAGSSPAEVEAADQRNPYRSV